MWTFVPYGNRLGIFLDSFDYSCARVYRLWPMVASERGVVIPAGNLGKWKTATTLLSICLFLIAYMFAPGFMYAGIALMQVLELIAAILMYIAVVLTIVSGVQYIVNSKHILAG